MADDPTQDPATGDDDEDLGEPGKKALDTERKARRNAERQLKDATAALKAVEDRDKSELQKAQDALAERDAQLADIPKQARAQAIKFASAATRKNFLDPEDALAFIGDVDISDAAAVDSALDELATRKPHLVRAETKKPLPTRPKPKDGEATEDSGVKGKERAAAALRQFRNV